jgi:hypothetical protein
LSYFLFQITFALELFSSDAMRFVPVNFGFADVSAAELDEGDTLHLSPSSITIKFSETGQVTNGVANGDHFFVCDVADNEEGFHAKCLRSNTHF